METKTDKVKAALLNGDYKEALKLAHSFKLGFTKEEKRTLQIAHEMANIAFYKSIGIDVEAEYSKAVALLEKRYIGE